MPCYRINIAVNSKVKQGYSFAPVIEADRAAEAAIRAEIAGRFSHHAILGKELGLTGSEPMLHAEALRILGSPPLRRP
jgi:fructose-1,6-bisphosphatase/inositol monophosphatase family enzyme